MNDRIIHFIQGQTVATICCVDEENYPYCFSCFYAFNEQKALLHFKSSAATHHVPIMQKNPVIAGAIQPDKLNKMAIKGIQFTGTILRADDPACQDASSTYHKEYPFAYAVKGEVWTIQLGTVKMTDNTLTFGKKLTWKRGEASYQEIPQNI
jgi:uncharacterized protein